MGQALRVSRPSLCARAVPGPSAKSCHFAARGDEGGKKRQSVFEHLETVACVLGCTCAPHRPIGSIALGRLASRITRHTHVHRYICMHMCTYIGVDLYKHINIHIRMHIQVHMYKHMHINVSIRACMGTHIHIRVDRSSVAPVACGRGRSALHMVGPLADRQERRRRLRLRRPRHPRPVPLLRRRHAPAHRRHRQRPPAACSSRRRARAEGHAPMGSSASCGFLSQVSRAFSRRPCVGSSAVAVRLSEGVNIDKSSKG